MNRLNNTLPRLIASLLLTVAAIFADAHPIEALAPDTPTGNRPPALTPFSEDDPIPKLELQPHARPDSPRKAAETFLAFMSVGYDPSVEGYVGGTVMGGNWKGYEHAWNMMGDSRPSYHDFQAQWAGTIRMGVTQIEPITPTVFFVELERVAWYRDHWAVSYFAGHLDTIPASEGWRVVNFAMCTESLAQPNIIGHTSWHHDDQALASIMAGFQPGEYDVAARRYERRTVFIQLRNKRNGRVQAYRMARVVEGSWIILEPGKGQICGR